MLIKTKLIKEPEILALRLTIARHSLYCQPLEEALVHEKKEMIIDTALLMKALEIQKKIEAKEKTKWYIS